MRGTKPSSTSCPAFCGSVTPSYRRTATYIALAYLLHIEGGVSKARQLANEPSVEGCKRRRNFLELRLAELRRITLMGSSANRLLKRVTALLCVACLGSRRRLARRLRTL